MATRQLPQDARGAKLQLSVSEVVTTLIFGTWLGIVDKTKLYYYIKRNQAAEFPTLPHCSKFVEATNRVGLELRTLLSRQVAANRQAQRRSPAIFSEFDDAAGLQSPSAVPSKLTARKSRNESGYWYGFKLHVQCDERGRLCPIRLSAANMDDRKLLCN